jgi:hypothetical protein
MRLKPLGNLLKLSIGRITDNGHVPAVLILRQIDHPLGCVVNAAVRVTAVFLGAHCAARRQTNRDSQ